MRLYNSSLCFIGNYAGNKLSTFINVQKTFTHTEAFSQRYTAALRPSACALICCIILFAVVYWKFLQEKLRYFV